MIRRWDLSLSLGILLTIRLNNLHTFETWHHGSTARILAKLSKEDRARLYSWLEADSFNPIAKNMLIKWIIFLKKILSKTISTTLLLPSGHVFTSRAATPAAGCEDGATSFPAVWWDSKSREWTLFDRLMLAVVPKTGRSLDLQTSFWWTSSILGDNKRWENPQMPKKSTLAFSVPFITGLVLILDLTTWQLQPLMTSTPTSTTCLPLNLVHLHGGFSHITEIAVCTPKRPPQKEFSPFLAQHTCRFIPI